MINYINKLKKMLKKPQIEISPKENKKNKLSEFQNKAKGSLYGLYIGDALGAPLEFVSVDHDEDPVLKEYGSGGVHRISKGEWTDDTSMALALMHSLTNNGFDLKDQIEKYINWQQHGYYSSRTYCFDIGITTISSLNKYKRTGDPYAGSEVYNTAGNGSLMRLAPVPLYYYNEGLERMIDYSVESSKTTHQNKMVLDCIKYFVIIFERIMNNEKNKDSIIKLTKEDINKYNIESEEFIDFFINDNILEKKYKELNPEGFVIYSLIVSIWCFYHTNSFSEAIIKAVNLGGDSDTNGAITGQLAGAFYGYNSIPNKFKKGLYRKDVLEKYTNPFLDTLKEK